VTQLECAGTTVSTLSIANLLEVASGAPGRLTFFMEVTFTLRYAGDEPPPDYVQVHAAKAISTSRFVQLPRILMST
jgi:hypothetical protein